MQELFKYIFHLRLALGDPPGKTRGCCISASTASNKRRKKAKDQEKDDDQEEDEEQEGDKAEDDDGIGEEEEEKDKTTEDPVVEVKTSSKPKDHKKTPNSVKASPCRRFCRKKSTDDADVEIVVISEGKSKERLQLDEIMAKIAALELKPTPETEHYVCLQPLLALRSQSCNLGHVIHSSGRQSQAPRALPRRTQAVKAALAAAAAWARTAAQAAPRTAHAAARTAQAAARTAQAAARTAPRAAPRTAALRVQVTQAKGSEPALRRQLHALRNPTRASQLPIVRFLVPITIGGEIWVTVTILYSS